MSPNDTVDNLEQLMSHPAPFDLSKLQQADDFYNSLLAKGLIKKRGYTLLGIEDRSATLNIGLNRQLEEYIYRPAANI